MQKSGFDQYYDEAVEPGKRERAYAWATAIGLQAVLNKFWEFGENVADVSSIDRAVERLIVEREQVYQDLLRSQGETQRAVLKAIAMAGVVAEPTSQEFVRVNRLSAPSTVRSVLSGLKTRDLVFQSASGWIIYDRLFGKWLRREYD